MVPQLKYFLLDRFAGVLYRIRDLFVRHAKRFIQRTGSHQANGCYQVRFPSFFRILIPKLPPCSVCSEFIGDAVEDTASSASLADFSPARPSIFRRVEHGFVTIDEIREKLITAREIRAFRASELSARGTEQTTRGSRMTAIQNPIIQRRSDTNLQRHNRHTHTQANVDIEMT